MRWVLFATVPSPSPAPVPPSVPDENIQCPPNFDTKKYRTTSYTDGIETTTKISPKRANANVGQGAWIPGRATYYGTDPRIEKSRVKCGEPAGQYGILAYGNCGYTDGDGKTSYPEDMYAAAADTNADYPGACGRCYQVGDPCAAGVWPAFWFPPTAVPCLCARAAFAPLQPLVLWVWCVKPSGRQHAGRCLLQVPPSAADIPTSAATTTVATLG